MDDLVKRCVDLDQWKHSWHNNFEELEDYEKARDVIKEKIESRIKDLQLLNDGLNKIDCIIAREREYLVMDELPLLKADPESVADTRQGLKELFA
jgi:hypothetical protein